MNGSKEKFNMNDILKKQKEKDVFVISESITYPEQFFDITFHEEDMKTNPTSIDIHISEWESVIYHLNCIRKNDKIKYLDKQLEYYLEKSEKSEMDFLNHMKYMFKQYTKFMSDDTKSVVRTWLSNNLIIFGKYEETKSSPKFMPKVFVEKNWNEIVKLIRQNDGVIMAAVKSFCGNTKTPKEINSITKAVSRLCDSRDINHKKNFSIDKT